MEVTINGNVNIGNVMPTITVRLSRYELGQLVTDGKVNCHKEHTCDSGEEGPCQFRKLHFYQDVVVEVKD